ncbi:MAG: MmgE/PrpD family protein [bacterium]
MTDLSTEVTGTVEPATRALADWLANLRYEDLSAETRRQARLSLVDYLGCALLGSTRKQAKQLFDLVEQLGGAPQATVIGWGHKTSVPHAGLVNGVLGSASLLLEDTAAESFAHPGVNVVPAALAAAEYVSATGADLLLGIVAGYEVSMRVGAAAGWRTFKKGWHPRGAFNVFGAAAAAGKLLGLTTSDQFCAALGLAGTQASGLVEPSSPYDGWLLLSGSGAQDGVMAALLARQGWSAGCTVIKGPRGYLKAVAATPRPERILEGLGDRFEISSITRKRHASSSLTHSAIDLILELKAQHNLTPQTIEAIDVRTIDVHYLLEKHWPQARLEGPHSLPYLLAVAFLDGEVLDPQFEPRRREDLRVRYLFDRVSVVADEEMTAQLPGRLPTRIVITLKDGRVLEGYRAYPKGDPRDPLTVDELRTKFYRLGGVVLSEERLGQVWSWIESADEQPSVLGLTDLLVGD